MKISNYNQLLAITTILSGVIIFATLWHQYQTVEKASRDDYESRLLVQTVNHIATMSKLWLTSQDLLFSGRQTYLARGIKDQSEHLKKTLLEVKVKLLSPLEKNRVGQLISDIQLNDQLVERFSDVSAQSSFKSNTTIAQSDKLTQRYVNNLEQLTKYSINNNQTLSNQANIVVENFTLLSILVVSLYVFFYTIYSKLY
jgi:hypothetical protein